jgi:phosphomannomutase
MIDQSIFREYDIRGIVPTQINETSVNFIAHAIASKCKDENINEFSSWKRWKTIGREDIKPSVPGTSVSRYFML